MFSIDAQQFEIHELEPGIGSFEIKTSVGYSTYTAVSRFEAFPKRDQSTILKFVKIYEHEIDFTGSTLYFPETVFTDAFQIQFSEKELSTEERFARLERELADLRARLKTQD